MDNDHLSPNSPDDASADKRVRLRVLGISYSQVQTGVYALILADVNGPFRIPVMIGAAEAQAIAMKMEGVVPPRPLTHDLFTTLSKAFGIHLSEVFIYRFEDGVFYSELTFTDGSRTVKIDSRTSDAVAIAMRTGAPIFTTQAILAETGFEMEEVSAESDEEAEVVDDQAVAESEDMYSAPIPQPKLENYVIEELERTLADLIEHENYEEAARVSEILRRKREGLDDDNQSSH